MWSFLGWLYARIGRVVLFFSSLYTKIVNAANHAWRWAVDQGEKALKAAKHYIIVAVNVVKVIFNLAIAAVRNFLVSLVDNAIALALKLFEIAKASFKIALGAATNGLIRIIKQIEFDIRWALVLVEVKLFHFIQDGLRKLNLEIGKILIRWLMLERIRVVFHQSNLAKILDFINRMYDFLDAFMRSPLAFIMNMLRLVFLTFFEFTIGYALAGPKYKLPPWPSWDAMESQPGPGPKPPAGSGLIGSPLASLYISGYTYNSPPGHRGIDLGLANGDSVFACHDGIVRAAGWSTVGYGYFIVLDSETWWTRYAHAQQLNVSMNDRVDKGDVIGLGDDTGQSTGPHLHLEVKHRGSWVDPVTVLPI